MLLGQPKSKNGRGKLSKALFGPFPGKSLKHRRENESVAAGRVVFHPGASADYTSAFAWYYARGHKLARDFEKEIDRGIRLIVQNPLRWAKFDGERRRIIIRKFPYSIIYELHDSDVVVLAVAHGKRRPKYWRDRLPGD
jgi:plasmid stabilization system protein ParE